MTELFDQFPYSLHIFSWFSQLLKIGDPLAKIQLTLLTCHWVQKTAIPAHFKKVLELLILEVIVITHNFLGASA